MAGKEKIARNAETPAQRFERVISKVAARHQRARVRREKQLREMAVMESQSSPEPGA